MPPPPSGPGGNKRERREPLSRSYRIVLIATILTWLLFRWTGAVVEVTQNRLTGNSYDRDMAFVPADEVGTAMGGGATLNDEATLQSPGKPFDPFVGLTFSNPDPSANTYSSYHCVATGTPETEWQVDPSSNYRALWTARTCSFTNLYYRLVDQTFHYFSSPTESILWKETAKVGNDSLNELKTRMDVSLAHVPDDLRSQKELGVKPWKPIVHEKSTDVPPVSSYSVVGPNKSVFLLYQPFHSMNFGHLIWDDILSLFSMLDLFGKGEDDSLIRVPFFVENRKKRRGYGGSDMEFKCSPWNWSKWNLCVSRYKKWIPPLLNIKPDCSGDILRTGNWLLGEEKIGTWKWQSKQECPESQNRTNLPPPKATYVLLPDVMVGTGRLNYFGCQNDCSIGRGPQFYRFRAFLLLNLFGSRQARQLAKKPPLGYITFSLPAGSTRPNQVHWFEHEINATKKRYGSDVVRVVDMAKLSIQDQAQIAMDSAVFFTNHGGGGVVSIFLQRGTSVLTFWHGVGRSDHNFYESAGYFRTTWVSVQERPFVGRTMALLDVEVQKTTLKWPAILCAKHNS